MATLLSIPLERIQARILVAREQRVILDADLAVLYGVPTKRLNEQVKRNLRKFPVDFMRRSWDFVPSTKNAVRSEADGRLIWIMNRSPAREALFRQWLDEHRGIFFKVSRSYARSATDLTDLDQELRLQLWNSTASYAGEAKPSTWVYRVCLNTAITWHRNTSRRTQRLDPEADMKHLVANNASPAEHAEDRDLLEQLYGCIHAMADIDRALVLLSLDGVSYREISEVTGLNENQVGVGLTRARQRLADLMKGLT